MKVRVEMTIEIDPDAWEQVYGTSEEGMRVDVKNYARHQLQDSAAAEDGAIKAVVLK